MTRTQLKMLALLCTVAGLAGTGFSFRAGTPAPPPVAAPTVAAAPTMAVATPGLVVTTEPASPAPVDTAALAEDPRIKQVNSAHALASYLDELESTARKNGKVTDEMARASEAGKRLIASMGGPNVARVMFDFSDCMRKTSFELQWSPTLNELAALRTKLATVTNAAEREKLLADYRAKSAKLPAAGQVAVAAQLKQTLEGT